MDKKSTKAIKIYFHKPLNCSWEELGKALHDCRYKFSKIMNYGIRQYYFFQVEKERLKVPETDEKKIKNGKKWIYPSLKELPRPTKEIYDYIRSEYPEFPTYCISAINQALQKKWDADCKDVFYSQNKSLPTYKVGYPILATNQQYAIQKNKDGYVLSITLLSTKHKGLRRFEIQLKTKKIKGGQKAILDRMIDKSYKMGELKISKNVKKKNWLANISYTFPLEDKGVKDDIICGIDLGINTPFACAISDSWERLYSGDGREIHHFRQQIRNRRKAYQRQSKVSTRKGKGRVHILRPVGKLSEKERNFRETKYHQYSKQIIDFCIKNQAGVIQLEDLSELIEDKQENWLLRDWAISEFHNKVEYKAKEAGIKIKYVDPDYTSQRCSKCGHISKDNRKTQENFECVECGLKLNADYNAAKNLSINGIAEIIEASVPKLIEKKAERKKKAA